METTFLNGDLEEDIYTEHLRVHCTYTEDKVCELLKSLFGLKQAPKARHEKFKELVLSNEFKINGEHI